MADPRPAGCVPAVTIFTVALARIRSNYVPERAYFQCKIYVSHPSPLAPSRNRPQRRRLDRIDMRRAPYISADDRLRSTDDYLVKHPRDLRRVSNNKSTNSMKYDTFRSAAAAIAGCRAAGSIQTDLSHHTTGTRSDGAAVVATIAEPRSK